MLGYKWWRFTVNLDEYLKTSPSHEREKTRRRVHHKELWQVTTKDPKTFHVKCLVTIKSRLKFGSHWEFRERIREVLKKNPLPAHIVETVNRVKKDKGFTEDTKEFDLLTALTYIRSTQVINRDTMIHLELMINYLTKKQYGKEMFPHRTAGAFTEQVELYKDVLSKGTALPVTPEVTEAPSTPQAIVEELEEAMKKTHTKMKRKSVMSISEEKVTFD